MGIEVFILEIFGVFIYNKDFFFWFVDIVKFWVVILFHFGVVYGVWFCNFSGD